MHNERFTALLTENNTIGDQKTERKIREKLTKI
jgi:hypothetical protein